MQWALATGWLFIKTVAGIGFVGAGVAERLADNRLSNVESVVAEPSATNLTFNTYDAAVFVFGFLDLYYAVEGWPAIDADSLVPAIYNSVKPGEVIGIVDHAATLGVSVEGSNTLHLIDPLIIHHDLGQVGFFKGESDVLRNPDDYRIKSMSDPAIRGNTDRVVYLFRKPSN
jgi:predicted methyltransferase